jgi:HK97 family phage major capsid protein
MDKIHELLDKRGKLCDELDGLLGDETAFTAKEAEIAAVDQQIERAKRLQALAASRAQPSRENGNATQLADVQPIMVDHEIGYSGRPVRKVAGFDHYLRRARAQLREQGVAFTPNNAQPFRSFGEQLQAVARYYMGGRDHGAMDPRLVRAPTGAGEIDPSAGGFLVQTDFSTAVFMRAYEMGEILSRVRKMGLSTAANSIKIPAVDETSRVTGSRWGGVQSYWVGEGTTPTNTKPKFRLIELDLKKLMSLMYVTDELLADASVLTGIAGEAFSEEIMFMTEDGIFEGDGAGKPLGILNSNCLVTVSKETGQATQTIVYENVLKMWSRCWGRSRRDAIWTINQDNEPQLYAMSQVIGTAGVPVYLPANGISGSPYGTLFGAPVVTLEYNQTVGTLGDIVLADYSQYVLADKGGVQAASSMHVAFLTDEMVFRITYRVDGEPIWNAALTPFHGSNTLSPFVALAAR